MSTNDNTNAASDTNRAGPRVNFAVPVTKPIPPAGSHDSRALLIKDRKFDPAREYLETQQDPFKSTMCEVILTFSKTSNATRKKQAGISKMEMDDTFVPQSARVNTKLQHLESLKDDEGTKANLLEMEGLNKAHQEAYKKVITAQSKLDASHIKKTNNIFLLNLLLDLAKHRAMYVHQMHDTPERPIDTLNLGYYVVGAIALATLLSSIETEAEDEDVEVENLQEKPDLSIPNLFSYYIPMTRADAVDICNKATLKEGQASLSEAGTAAVKHGLVNGAFSPQTLVAATEETPAHFDHEVSLRLQAWINKVSRFLFNFLKEGLVPVERAIVYEHKRKCALLKVQISMRKQTTVDLAEEIEANIQDAAGSEGLNDIIDKKLELRDAALLSKFKNLAKNSSGGPKTGGAKPKSQSGGGKRNSSDSPAPPQKWPKRNHQTTAPAKKNNNPYSGRGRGRGRGRSLGRGYNNNRDSPHKSPPKDQGRPTRGGRNPGRGRGGRGGRHYGQNGGR
jgi:hypothetical protein